MSILVGFLWVPMDPQGQREQKLIGYSSHKCLLTHQDHTFPSAFPLKILLTELKHVQNIGFNEKFIFYGKSSDSSFIKVFKWYCEFSCVYYNESSTWSDNHRVHIAEYYHCALLLCEPEDYPVA